ncbi:MAG TPA: class I SAM-dependent methyltransferase [Acidimicrobiales bacterium]|nr:class I SAM-dependent methyltransferase [Acidimicrobiales bacterium]
MIYETPIDPDAENNSHSFALSMIGYNKSVLEVGCSTGYFTKYLFERGCEVVGIELDPVAAELAERWATHVVVGDLDTEGVWLEVKDEAFDVVLLGDVLEHLRDPLTSLRHAARKLKPSGCLIASIPNVAHGDVRIALMQGKFEYRDRGLLDRTHIHFFTLESARELLRQAGLVIVDTKRAIVPLFQSEVGVARSDVNPKMLDEMLRDPEIETYQFVMKSVRDNGSRMLADLSEQVQELSDRMHHETVRTALLRRDLHDSQEMAGQIRDQQKYVEALEGHASGLERNIEMLNDSLTATNDALVATEARYQAVLGMRTVQMTAPIRWVYNKMTGKNQKTPGDA